MLIKDAPKTTIKRLEFTATSVSKKDASGDCLIEGYANTSTKDRVGDCVLPSAFEKSLPTFLKNPVLLANHDWNDPCGKVVSAKITEKGLYIKARISDSRPDIKTLINEGCLSTFSIGYNEIDADFDDQTKTKYVKELELLEISVVTVPANVEASFAVSTVKVEEPADEKPAEEAKSAPAVRTASQLKDFIDSVKSAAGNDLTGLQVIAICEYFNNTKEEIMTKQELIKLLTTKSAPEAAAPVEAKKDEAAPAPAESQSADAGEFMKQVMAKLDAIGQALAQVLEASKADSAEDASEDAKPEDAPKADEGKAEDKPAADKPADEPKDEEMSDEEVEKQISELQAEIVALEDSQNS